MNETMNETNTLLKGKLTELKCIEYFLRSGYMVSKPELPYSYDFLLDTGNNIYKLQSKTCREISNGSCIEFNTSSITHNSKGYTKRTYDKKFVDYFCTYYNNNCYLIPFDICGTKTKTLRLLDTKNNQNKRATFAKDYLAQNVLKNL